MWINHSAQQPDATHFLVQLISFLYYVGHVAKVQSARPQFNPLIDTENLLSLINRAAVGTAAPRHSERPYCCGAAGATARTHAPYDWCKRRSACA